MSLNIVQWSVYTILYHSDKELYLTVYPSSRPNTDTVSIPTIRPDTRSLYSFHKSYKHQHLGPFGRSQAQQCTVNSVQCTVHCSQCSVQSSQYSVHSAQYTVHSVHCTVHSLLWTLFCCLSSKFYITEDFWQWFYSSEPTALVPFNFIFALMSRLLANCQTTRTFMFLSRVFKQNFRFVLKFR